MKLIKDFNTRSLTNAILLRSVQGRCFTLIFILISSFSFSQEITSSIDSTQIKIGSQFHLSIKANVNSTDRVSFPEGQTFGPLEVLESYPVDTVKLDGKYELIKKYGLTQFDSGRYVLPRLSVIVNEKAIKTDSFAVVVNNVVVDTTKQQMFDIKPIVAVDKPVSLWWLWLLLVILAAAVLGYGLYYFIKKRQTKKNEKEAMLYASPIEKALTQLQQLEQKELWQKGETKAYYSELTDITRTYIEEEVDVPAMESTSGELHKALVKAIRKQKIKLGRETLEQYKRVMETADLVKFAKSKPLDFEIEADRKIIDTFLMSLDKAIPRTEDETENLFAEELKRKKERKQKQHRILVPVAGVLMLLGIVGVFYIVTQGTSYIRDKYIGHSTASLLDEQWVTSDYGDPAIIVSTPKALKRIVDERIQNNLPAHIKARASFKYGNITDKFSIVLQTVAFKDTTKVNLDQAVDVNLQKLKSSGAKNITVETGQVELEEGINAKSARGTFSITDPKTNDTKRMKYQILVISQTGSEQDLWLISKENDKNAQAIFDRVFESVQLRKTVSNE